MKFELKLKNKNLKFDLIVLGAGLVLVFFYFLSRLINLTAIPVFADEAIYIRWAQVMRAVSSLRFLPLSDGKQPLFMWLVIPFLKFIHDPLIAGRLVSVLAGLGTMIGVFIASLLLFKKKQIAFFAALLYTITPFTLFFDRMALVDGLLSFFGVWFFVLGVMLVKKKQLDLALIAGMILGLGLLTKSPALFFALLLPTTLLLFNFKEKDSLLLFFKLIFLWGAVYFLAFAIYNILRLGPEFQMIAIRNKDYVFSLSEVFKHPLNPFWGNIKKALNWFWILLTPPIFILGPIGFFFALKKQFREALLIFIWIVLPLGGESAIAKVYTSRYVLFVVPLFLLFSAYGLMEIFNRFKNKILVVLFLSILFVFPIYQSLLLIVYPSAAWLPENERSGYLELWSAGYGIREAADYLKEVAKKEKVLVGTEGYFGTLPDGLQIYLEKVPGITVIGVGQPITEISSKLTDGLKDNRVFLLVNDSRLKIADLSRLKLINKYPKARNQKTGKQENLLLFEVLK